MYVCTNNTHQWHLADEGMQSFVGYVVNKYFTCTFQVISPPPCHSITIDQSLMIDNLISMGRGEGCSRILALTDQLFGILFYSHSVGFVYIKSCGRFCCQIKWARIFFYEILRSGYLFKTKIYTHVYNKYAAL